MKSNFSATLFYIFKFLASVHCWLTNNVKSGNWNSYSTYLNRMHELGWVYKLRSNNFGYIKSHERFCLPLKKVPSLLIKSAWTFKILFEELISTSLLYSTGLIYNNISKQFATIFVWKHLLKNFIFELKLNVYFSTNKLKLEIIKKFNPDNWVKMLIN